MYVEPLNMCSFPHYRIISNVKKQELSNGGTRVDFIASSYHPIADGIFHKISCYAFDDLAESILAKHLSKGCTVDLFCEERPFKTNEGKIEVGYRIREYICSPSPEPQHTCKSETQSSSHEDPISFLMEEERDTDKTHTEDNFLANLMEKLAY